MSLPFFPSSSARGSSLLDPGDPTPVRVLRPEASTPLLLVCDHAAKAVPKRLGSLGLPPEELGRHIGWDIGAAGVARRLSDLLGATAVLSSFSRLVVDCNRRDHDPTAIPEVSDGTPVPANRDLDAADRVARVEECYWPYHRTISAELDRLSNNGVVPALLAIHSFTPCLGCAPCYRPWHIGVLWDKDPRIPTPLIQNLNQVEGLVVGDNQPYTERDSVSFTLRYHAGTRGGAYAGIEIRQDEIAGAEGEVRYANLIARALTPILADPALYQASSIPTQA